MFFDKLLAAATFPVIKMSNPKAKSDTKAKQSVIVSIDKDKNIYVGQKRVIFDSLEPALRKNIKIGDSIKPAVVVNADSLVSWGDIVKIMQVAKKLGATTSASVSRQK